MPALVDSWDPNEWELYVYGLLQDRHGAMNVMSVPAKVAFATLLSRAARSKTVGQQVIFATSEDRDELRQMLAGVDCRIMEFDGYILKRL
jgi:hypothetical protein